MKCQICKKEIKAITSQKYCKKCGKQHKKNYKKNYNKLNKFNILKKAKKYYLKNKEKIIEYQKEYYKKNKERILEYTIKRYLNNISKIKEYDKKYYKKNKERILEYHKQYDNLNKLKKSKYDKEYVQKPEIKQRKKEYSCYYRNSKRGKMLRCLNNQKRRAIKNSIIHLFTKEEWKDKLEATKGICPGCKKYIGISKLSIDHIFPLSKAEPDRIYTIDDVQPLCKSCNSSKGNRI